MKCIMKCNKKENWNHLFECEDFIRKVLQNILGVTAKSEKFQKFQQLALEGKDNSNQPSESNVKDNANKLSNKVKDIQTGKIDRLQRSVSLVKKSMDTFVRKYICEDWIPIKKKVDKVTLYMSKKLLD
ncbi:hypothetical protein GLOIN_2v1790208 [Rhizophagus irregularis DAOM 181602=DAOM 197198]|nr:hypothetical protein GLOIN_2v1790208 [Rhizophagus irregularis DAOM 181602=DAOM 197198]